MQLGAASDRPVVVDRSFRDRSNRWIASVIVPPINSMMTFARTVSAPCRLEAPFGATDARALRQQDVRSFVTLDAQEAYLFSTTIRENVRLANPSANDEDIERALRRAQIWDWITSLPDGWDTFVGEEGTLVSGGRARQDRAGPDVPGRRPGHHPG